MPRKPGEKYQRQHKLATAIKYNKTRPLRHKFYSSAQWRKLRSLKLSLNPLCEECERHNLITPGQVVDHIIPIEDGGAPLDLTNLQTLCALCHNRKHAKGEGDEKVHGTSGSNGVQVSL